MVSTISQMVLTVFTNVASWFEKIMTSTGGMGFWLGCFLIWQVASKLLIPAVGGLGRGSDTVANAPKARKLPPTSYNPRRLNGGK